MAVQVHPIAQAGRADFLFHPTTPRVFLSAADGSISRLEIDKLDDTPKVDRHPDAPERAVHSLALTSVGDLLLSGGEARSAHLWTVAADGQLTHISLVGRCTSSILSVYLSPRGDLALLLSSDPVLKMVSLLDNSPAGAPRCHEGGRGAAFDPLGNYLVTVGWEGNVCLWDLSSFKEPLCTLPKELPRADPAVGSNCIPHWTQDGSMVALATPKGVALYARPPSSPPSPFNWKAVCTLGSKEMITARFSPNGLYLASVDSQNQVEIWKVSSKESLDRHRHSFSIQALAWSPLSNQVAFLDTSTALAIWDKPVPTSMPLPCDMTQTTPGLVPQRSALEFEPLPPKAPAAAVKLTKTDDLVEDSVMLDDDEAVVRKAKASRIDDADANLSSDDENKRRIAELRRRKKRNDDLQASFQPGAYGDAKRRVLCWNGIARMLRVEHEQGRASLDINFIDSTVGKTLRLTDRMSSSMGSVSSAVVVIASDSQLIVRPVHHWAPNAEWSTALPSGEQFIAVAAAARTVAAGTSAGVLRVWSATGHQLATLRVPRLVALVAHDDTLAVLSNTAGGGKSLLLLHLTRIERIVEVSCPVVGSGAVRWLGFSSSGLPLLQDSEGVLSALSGSLWHPLQTIPPDEWLVSVTDSAALVASCGGAHYPPFAPSPALEARPLQLPFLALDTTAGQHAELLAREQLKWVCAVEIADDDGALALDGAKLLKQRATLEKQTLVPLIVSALADGKTARAVDLAQLLQFPANLQLAFRNYLQRRGNESAEEFLARVEQLKPIVRANGLRLADRCKVPQGGAPTPTPHPPPLPSSPSPVVHPPAAAAAAAATTHAPSSQALTHHESKTPATKAAHAMPLPSSKITIADSGAQSPDEDADEVPASPTSKDEKKRSINGKDEKKTEPKVTPKSDKNEKKNNDNEDHKTKKKTKTTKDEEEKQVDATQEESREEPAVKKRKPTNPFAVTSPLQRGATMAGKPLSSVLSQIDKK